MRIGIYGFGNLGRGAVMAALKRADTQVVGVFTRRDPAAVARQTDVRVYPAEDVYEFADQIDVLLNCGGSKTDLPESTPRLSACFNVADTFDDHEKIGQHLARTDEAARRHGKLSLVAAGWDPGLFSLFRAYAAGLAPGAEIATFWGPGVSQGHTQALKRIPGVADAVQFTVPDKERMQAFLRGAKAPTAYEAHKRVCLISAPKEDEARIEREVKAMPGYFAGYDTRVEFLEAGTLLRKKTPIHGGSVLARYRTGARAGDETLHLAQLRLSLGSNPEFTGAVLVGFAHALAVLAGRGETGARTVLDLPAALLFGGTDPAAPLHFL